MSDTATMQTPAFSSLDESTAKVFMRESAIGRQQQAKSLSPEQEQDIRLGKQDQSLGHDDFVYGLTHADQVWDQINSVGQQQ